MQLHDVTPANNIVFRRNKNTRWEVDCETDSYTTDNINAARRHLSDEHNMVSNGDVRSPVGITKLRWCQCKICMIGPAGFGHAIYRIEEAGPIICSECERH